MFFYRRLFLKKRTCAGRRRSLDKGTCDCRDYITRSLHSHFEEPSIYSGNRAFCSTLAIQYANGIASYNLHDLVPSSTIAMERSDSQDNESQLGGKSFNTHKDRETYVTCSNIYDHLTPSYIVTTHALLHLFGGQ